MKLQSMKLHPFGRFTDQSWDLAKPLVVIHGPNELGKTTLRQAIFHALFTPTKQTDTQLKNSIKPWLPLPGGDHAHVTLAFEHEGKTWTLEKRWGAAQMSRLSDGTTAIADPAAVQSRLIEMLVHSEATYRHVLFTGQAELERTLVTIQEKEKERAGGLRHIRDLLKAGGDAADEIDEEKLKRKLEERIKKAFGRWDDSRGRPERQDGQERDLAYPWINGAGVIVKAWYEWQELVAEREDVLRIEREIDQLSQEVAADQNLIATAAAFIAQHGHLRAALAERAVLNERLSRLETQTGSLGTAYRDWPLAEGKIKDWPARLKELEDTRTSLQDELATAKHRQEAAAARTAFAAIEAAKHAWEEADAAAHKLPDPGAGRIQAVQRLQAAITDAENKLAARKLAWRIEAVEPGELTIQQGVEPAAAVPVGPTGMSGTAEARVRVVAGGITITVDSGGDDVDDLFDSLKKDRESLAAELEACNAATAADVRLMAEKRRDAEAVAKQKKAAYEGALGGTSFEDRAAAMKKLNELPNTRDASVVEPLLEAARDKLAAEKNAMGALEKSIEKWKEDYTDLETLEGKLLEARNDLRQVKDKLANAAALPAGFESPGAFIKKLEDAESNRLEGGDQLRAHQTACAVSVDRLADRRGEDLAEQAAAAERKFNRAHAEGRAYLRIQLELTRIAATADEDPLVGFGETVAEMFSQITGGLTTLDFEGQVPQGVIREGVSLPPAQLSQGGSGALGLAVRLAMAEAYLSQGGGFLMLDDPFVQFDKSRMAVAAGIVRKFSEKAQVIVLTCHDHHAARLEGDGAQTENQALG
jgi:DNA repair exonuclease SbcCD ATPase subunit